MARNMAIAWGIIGSFALGMVIVASLRHAEAYVVSGMIFFSAAGAILSSIALSVLLKPKVQNSVMIALLVLVNFVLTFIALYIGIGILSDWLW